MKYCITSNLLYVTCHHVVKQTVDISSICPHIRVHHVKVTGVSLNSHPQLVSKIFSIFLLNLVNITLCILDFVFSKTKCSISIGMFHTGKIYLQSQVRRQMTNMQVYRTKFQYTFFICMSVLKAIILQLLLMLLSVLISCIRAYLPRDQKWQDTFYITTHILY